MRRSYRIGFRTARRCWPVVLLLFATTLLPALLFTAASWSWLAIALDGSLATRTLLTDLDLNVFVDLFAHHSDSFRMLLATGGVLAVIFGTVGVWANATAVVAAADPLPLGAAVRRGLEVYPTFLALWLVSALINAAIGVSTFVGARLLMRWTAESASETTFYLIAGAALVCGAALLLMSVTVHDHARIHSAATGTGAARAYGWAAGFAVRREPHALPLTVLLVITGVAVWGVYQTVGMLIPTTSASGVAVSLLWGELLVLGRLFLRLWTFSAETELQTIHDVESA